MTEAWTDLGGRPSKAAPKAPKLRLPAHFCAHEDGHTCPWRDDENLSLGRCDCWTTEATN
jgi:hypothetical protein